MLINYEKETLTNKSSMNNNNWLTGGEVIQILRISTRTLQSYRDRGILPFAQVGRKIYYKSSDIDSYLEAHYIKARFQGGDAA